LVDAGQDFTTTVAVGMIIYNETDESKATVVTVDSDTTLTTTALVGTEDSELTWAEDDEYRIALAAEATTLVDAGQDFLTTVAVGMIIYNDTDKSEATVTVVVSDTQITTAALVGTGTSDLTWAMGDEYSIYLAAGTSDATTLVDATQDFETTVAVGMIIYNVTDESEATVVTVDSDTTLTTTALTALVGTEDNDLTWAMGDEYSIYLPAQATTLVDAMAGFPVPAPQNFLTTVAVGMTIYNETDNSEATVVTVDSDTQITTTALVARPGDRVTSDLVWTMGDKYWIYQGPLIPGAAFDGTGREIVVRGSAHANDIGTAAADRAPDYCADCHDPHSLEADCTGCHTGLSATAHPVAMAQLTCVACHGGDADIDGMGWDDLDGDDVLGSDGDVFTIGTVSTPAFPPGAPSSFAAANTHILNRAAKNCQSCHYVIGDLKTAGSRGAPDVLYTEDNPWGLSHKDNT